LKFFTERGDGAAVSLPDFGNTTSVSWTKSTSYFP